MSRLTSLTVDLSGTANDVTKTFTYNPANQIVTQTTSNDAYVFTGLANSSTTSTTNGLNELATVGGVTAANDTNANLTYAGTGTFSYDVENKLLHVTTGGVAANSIYDPLDRLTQLTGTAVSDRTFVTDPIAGDAVVAEHSSGGALQGRYVFVGMNEPIVSYDNAGNRTWLAADERGSIIAAVNASGAASAIYSYDEYGVPAASNAGRFGYTGQVRLPEVVEAGLYYYKNRMYLSPLGRFPQPDPIGYVGGVNLYAYVGNDPVNLTDPLGLAALENGPDLGIALNCLDLCAFQFAGPGGPPIYVTGNRCSLPEIVCAGERPSWDSSLTGGIGTSSGGSGDPGNPRRGGYDRNDDKKDSKKYNPKKNYCGGEGGTQLPNSIAGVSINDLCYNHDMCYGGSGTPRETCDETFGVAILIRIGLLGGIILPSGTSAILGAIGGATGYLIVRFGGKSYYVPGP